MWRKGNSHSLLLGMFIGTATMENSMEAPQEIKNRTTIWCRNYTWGYLSEGNKNTTSKIYTYPYVHEAFIDNSQVMEATKLSINTQMDKEGFIYVCIYVYIYTYIYEIWTHTGIWLSHKKRMKSWASLVAQWLSFHLPMQRTQFDPWHGEIPHATEQLSPCATTTELVL